MSEPIEDPLTEAGQAIGAALRTGAVAAGQLVQMRLMRQAHEDRQSAAADQARAGALQERLRTEQATAAAIYGPTRHPSWWREAAAGDVARAWDTAAAFQSADPAAARALADLSQGLAARPQLREQVLAEHPESLAAQALAPTPTVTAGAAGADLAAAAELDADAARVAPDLPPDPHAPTPAADPAGRLLNLSAQRAEASAVAGVVAPDFPAGGSSVVGPLLDAAARAAPPGIAAEVPAAASERHQAASITQLVDNDFPAGEALPRPGRPLSGGTPTWQPHPHRIPELSSPAPAGVQR